ncbi:hypothetical protein SU69_08505 [Thermosipho melanesiensis]|uniref:Uncharacterized protein n=1 Tax=Thermosipho melanesiensis TaxID=46541 RepID=A0ABM6GGR0_9BACT|nr:hypothetical protein [Thermosipho melanesiensis]APT74940.1 hypothetical protein BW47_08880 [Thermosipho melanesiensis]OOC35268.1 hypothetical protein SU69_08505 [Thermosipho melanesiensis]OOC35487.1 hypothetical protein SU70_08515 [Thermosipho melanesiensis]OOC36523.1 hypothetical protein SU68_08570 [Thermosipho melanesiensis]OOC40195.1 hypothetical protein SU71_08500 [Thermosipho melanesiensis]
MCLKRIYTQNLKPSEWENFNIAFFEETNVCKSTLIEIFISRDGSSIGDGHKDFTKRINEKSLYFKKQI